MSEHVIPEEHVVSPRIYLTIFAALMVLTAVTVWVAFYDLAWLNVFVAVTIAVVKATLVILYFMHVRWSSRLTQVIVASGVIWFVILLVFTFSDYLTRDWGGAPY
jgi:cytochrome c oxidase subunit 4